MNIFYLITPLGTAVIIYAVFRTIAQADRDPDYQAHRRQQKALRAHYEQQGRERKATEKWWKACW